MNKKLSEFLNSMFETRMVVVFGDLKDQHRDIKFIDDNYIDEIETIVEKLDMPGKQLKEDGYESILVAYALLMRSIGMMYESEPKHKCELFAQLLRDEADKMDESIPKFFTKDKTPVIVED